jgi:hypothetical protein
VVAREALRALDELGPFFAVRIHREEPGAPWRPVSELVDRPAVLDERVRRVRARLAGDRPAEDVELRVAASVAHLGLVARLVSPVLAVSAVSGELLEPRLRRLRWRAELGAFPLSAPETTTAADPDALAERVLDGPARQLVEATAAFSVSPRVLWGNVASAVSGAVSAVADGLPQHAAAARELRRALLEREPLRGTGDVVGGTFRRRSCCLIYRVAPERDGSACGDCVLLAR